MRNAFKLTKQLEQVGFSREQAEIQVQVITEIIEDDLASKQDLNNLETNLRQDLKILETSLRQDMKILETNFRSDAQQLESSLRNDFQQLESRLTIKLGTLLIIGFTSMATLMKFWVH
jgi:hypothetical protein